MAPLTGSDALNYHFDAQKQILEHGFRGDLSNYVSFLCGQHHLLILFGLALGSEQLAMGLVFLGGVLTTASLACLALRWASMLVAAGFALLFLLTPLVFWQAISAGSPDVYMAFFATITAIVFCQEGNLQSRQQAFLVGWFAGGIAGAKYRSIPVASLLLPLDSHW